MSFSEDRADIQRYALQQHVLNMSRLFATRADKEFAKFTKTWTTGGEQLSTHIRDAFPLTRAVIEAATEPKTDPDPPGSEEPAAQETPPSDVAASA